MPARDTCPREMRVSRRYIYHSHTFSYRRRLLIGMLLRYDISCSLRPCPWSTASGRPPCTLLQPPSTAMSLRQGFSRSGRPCLSPTGFGRPHRALVRPPSTEMSLRHGLSHPGGPCPSLTASEPPSCALLRPP